MFSSARTLNRTEMVLVFIVAVFAIVAGLAVGWGQIDLVVVLIGGVVVSIAIFFRPALGAALILAMAPLEGQLAFRGVSLVLLVTVLCTAIFFLRVIIQKKKVLVDLTTGLALIFLIWSLLTILWTSADKLTSIFDWVSFAMVAALYFLLINLVSSREDVKLILWGHVLGGLVLSIFATSAMLSHDFSRSEWVIGFGINLVSRLAGLNFLISLLLYQLESSCLGRGVIFASVIASGIATVVTLSRGTWLGVTASLIVWGIISTFKGRIRVSFVQIFLWVLGGFLLIFLLNTYVLDEHGLLKLIDRFQTGVTLSDSAGGRFDIWAVAWSAFSNSPLWGHGFQSFKYEFTLFDQHGGEIKAAHNAYVLMAVEEGLIGVFLIILVQASVFINAWRFLAANRAGAAKVSAWVMALFTYLFVATLVDGAEERKYFWYILGLITLLIRFWAHGLPKTKDEIQPEESITASAP